MCDYVYFTAEIFTTMKEDCEVQGNSLAFNHKCVFFSPYRLNSLNTI